MEGSTPQLARRTLTPAVVASALFVVVCAGIAVTFVAARGGLQLPVAPGATQVAVGSPAPSTPPPGPSVTVAPSTPTASLPPGETASPIESPPAPSASAGASPSPTPLGSPDSLSALPGCAGIAGCHEYEIRPGDTLSGVASRYAIPVWIVLALNPEVTDANTIVVGQTLYLGRDPFLRLTPCPDRPDCSLYEVRAGDSLSTIAGRFGLSLDALLDANPEITDANAIRTGQLIRLPQPAA
jgi:hypothetical protein